MFSTRRLVFLELVVVVAAPLLMAGTASQAVRFSAIFLVAAYCLIGLWRAGAVKAYLRPNFRGFFAALPGVLLRSGIAAVAIAGLVYALHPNRLFCIPRANPDLMLIIACFYAFVSVLPQEIAFRAYAAFRLDGLKVAPVPATLLSAAVFGWVHILYGSWISVLLAFIAGIAFYRTYRNSGSILAAWLEHSLYGLAVFAIGLDHLFYSGPGTARLESVCMAAPLWP
ncbi:CPBP family intramembrane glutamic endopeptidase [Rhodobium gokarnense]|uniref:Membrane protease YdiL (CAAX protease family) n=1 Tax=Rhodobium gokarnense TaxID=364296 RepID=A0ABT3HGW5_9HYPH|nr:CPBP family intramembrane glutamic endopeptidase [Rhodobium gokarnense]MCW2309638.1 membrane protease YdiL (CAAX protease family) [Rhodobium gokarnense]